MCNWEVDCPITLIPYACSPELGIEPTGTDYSDVNKIVRYKVPEVATTAGSLTPTDP